jgi:hypothetical protein
MLQRIRRRLLGAFTTDSRRKARGRPPRRLNFERLEGRELLTSATTAALNASTAISDGSFEVPALAAGTFQYAPNGSPWQFAAGGGVCANGSPFNNPNAPDGVQAAFLQGNGSMGEFVYLDAGAYSLSFMAAQRPGANQTHSQEFQVLVDGLQVGLVTPTDSTYRSYQTSIFTVTAGPHTVEFVGLNPLGGDNTAFIDEVALSAADALSDGSFETPSLPANTFQYAPNGSPWQFSGAAGVTGNRSGFTNEPNVAGLPVAGNPDAPNGTQVGFVQDNGSMSQSVYLDAGTYNVSFLAAQRAGRYQTSYQSVEVLVDSAPVGTITPTGPTYLSYQSSNFTVAAGTHTIELLGLNPQGGDNTAFIDEAVVAQANLFSDGIFATPLLAADAFQYAPNGSPWQFSPSAGVCSNGSAFGNPIAPNGPDNVQAAFLQGAGSMSQSVYLDAGTYSVSFMAAQRAGQAHYQEFEVLVGSTVVGTITPTGTTYGSYETTNFAVTAGTYTVEFLGLNPLGGDNTAFIAEAALSASLDTITDSSFEMPPLAANTFQYAPNGSPWQFSGEAGVCGNGSAFGNPAAPSGSQAAFLQGSGSMSQSLYLDAGTYTLSFMAAQRPGQPHYQEVEVLVDGAQAVEATPAGTAYAPYQTSNFTVAAGTHTIELLGINPLGGDNTAFIDELTLSLANVISDDSFEVPALAAKTFQYAPSGSPWQFAAGAGVCSNGSAFGNPNAPDGIQAAFIQGSGSMTESVNLDAGTYTLSFLAAQRTGPYQAHYQELQVLVDGLSAGTVTPISSDYAAYESANFTVTAGTHSIEFLGINPLGGDNTAFVDEVALSQANLSSDGSFEAPALPANSFQYVPGGSPWTFAGQAGVCSNGSAFGNPDAPDGVQAAFLQGTGSMTESISMDAGTYSLAFMAAQRAGPNQAHYQELQVSVDGTIVGTVTPTSTGYAGYQVSNFTVAAGTHTIELVGLNPLGGDNTAFVDEVQIYLFQ